MIAAVLNALSNGDEIHLKFQLDGSTAPYCMIRMQAVVSERERGAQHESERAQPGRTASQVARDHSIAPGQLFLWPRQLLAEAIANAATLSF